MKYTPLFAAALFLLSVPVLVSAQNTTFPLTIENCGFEITYEAAPEKAVTMNQAATEIMLALGLEDKLVGTAYLDDTILPEYEETYNAVPVLAVEYPSQEVLFGAEPDFVYGSYSSAFGDEAAGSRDSLLDLGITSYVSPMACEDRSLRPETVTIDNVFGEIRDIGRIFGVEDRAEALIADQQADLDALTNALGDVEDPLTVFWYDSGADEVYAGACCGAPGLIMDLLGVENIFEDAAGSWATVNWEDIVARDPDVIVLVNASWDTAESKIETLMTNPAYADMTAVKNKKWVMIDFSYTSPNVRNVTAVTQIAEFLYPDLFPLPEATVEPTIEATAEAQ